MDGRWVEIDGETFDLDDPEDKKRAIRAWLKAKSRERRDLRPGGGTAEEKDAEDRCRPGGNGT